MSHAIGNFARQTIIFYVMIVYNNTKGAFVQDVRNHRIAEAIFEKMREKGIPGGADREFISWQNSLMFMRDIVDISEIDDDVNIAIEYNIPHTSKRVDFIISGSDRDGRDNIVIIELKQWQHAELVDDQMHYSVRTYVANENRIVCHPSYQAFSYSRFISNYSQQISDGQIGVKPCAYLHNFEPAEKSVLSNEIYKEWFEEAPFFVRNESGKLTEFITKYITKKSSSGDLMYLIDHGRLKPTKALQDCLTSMVMGHEEFILLDEQAVCFDMCLKTMSKCIQDKKKRVIVIQGGPGTGKSVLAVNLLMRFIQMQCNASYETKNSSPRNAFLSILSDSDARKAIDIKHLFRSPFALNKCPDNAYDCLIVDEAHRLVSKMYGDWGGENQVKEAIKASLLTIFMLDEDQRITTKDIGSVCEIEKWAGILGARVINTPETVLVSQFRCNGSDAYIQFIDRLLQRKVENVFVDLKELSFDFKVYDNPCQLRDDLREKNRLNNKSRMVAGYCYDWNVKHRRGEWDIVLPQYGFNAKWNLEGDNIWAINPNSFEEIGCIHTAQGLEFDYVGVLIGRDLVYNPLSGKVETHKESISKDDKTSGIRTTSDEEARILILNTYKTLLTRGQKGCYVFCEDDNLREYFKSFKL